MMERILTKLTSGRWLLSLICGLTFMILACNSLIDSKDVITIITIVFTFYFYREKK